MSPRDTIAAEGADARAAVQGLRVDLDALFKRMGAFDHEAQAADEVLAFVAQYLVRLQFWLEDVGKETR